MNNLCRNAGIAVAIGVLLIACSDNLSSPSNGGERIDAEIISSPKEMQALPNERAVTLHWTNPLHAGFSHVIISWFPDVEGASLGVPASPHFVSGASGEIRSKTIEELTNGALYRFTIIAVSESGKQSDAVELSATPRDVTPPGAVSEFTAIPGDERIDLKWINPLDPDFHYVEIELTSADGHVQSIRVEDSVEAPGSPHSQIVTELINGIEYTVTIIAFDGSGLSSRVTKTATPMNADPLGVREIAIAQETEEEGVIPLSWSNPDESDLVEVEVGWLEVGSDELPMSILTTEERYVIRGLTPGVRYSITLTALYNRGARVASQAIRGNSERSTACGRIGFRCGGRRQRGRDNPELDKSRCRRLQACRDRLDTLGSGAWQPTGGGCRDCRSGG